MEVAEGTPRKGLWPRWRFIKEHRIGKKGVLAITRGGPIRVQIRRAVALITALCREKIIIPQESIYRRQRILVIGGGVSGVAAACTARAAGFRVDLVESASQFFPLQAKCASRWLHPHEYDWPLRHFEEPSYPFTKRETDLAPATLHWDAGRPSTIAKKWQKKLATLETESRGTVKCHTCLHVDIAATARDMMLRLSGLDPANPAADLDTARYTLILLCLGANETALRGCPYTGYRYWSDDPFGHQQLGLQISPPHKRRPDRNDQSLRTGLRTSAHPIRILISGSGDGGLQELLRLTFRQIGPEPLSALSILQDLRVILRDCPAFQQFEQGPVPDRFGKVYRPPANLLWDDQTQALHRITHHHAWAQVVEYFHGRLHEEFLFGLRDITLAMGPMQNFQSFALNSFLGRLFMAFVAEATCPYRDYFRLLPLTSVHDVASTDTPHVCTDDADLCHPIPHRVTITEADGTQTDHIFDIVILRHGQAQLISCD